MKRILLVDDDEDFLWSLVQTLQHAGYEIQSVNDGDAALNLCRRHAFDLVITDLMMPGKDGLETVIELHRFQPRLKIIAISGAAGIDPIGCLSMARHLGAAMTLTKPFAPQKLLELVAGLLGELKGSDGLPARELDVEKIP